MQTEEPSTTLEQSAANPKVVEIDGQRVEQHSLQDQIAADRYLAGKKALKTKSSGLKFQKMSHSGAF